MTLFTTILVLLVGALFGWWVYRFTRRDLHPLEKDLITQPMRKRIALHPGDFTVQRIAECYRLPPNSFVVWDDRRPVTYQGKRPEDYLHLHPLPGGEYFNWQTAIRQAQEGGDIACYE